MKNLIWTLLVIGLCSCNSANKSFSPEVQAALADLDKYEAIPWVGMGDLELLVSEKPRKIIVDVYTPWCGPCKMMDRNTFTNGDIINQFGKNFYAVKFNAEGPDPINFQGKEYGNPKFDPNKTRGRNARHELAPFFAVRGYPTLVVMDENLKVIDKIVGYKTPEQLKVALEKHI